LLHQTIANTLKQAIVWSAQDPRAREVKKSPLSRKNGREKVKKKL